MEPLLRNKEGKPGLFLICVGTLGIPLKWRRVCLGTPELPQGCQGPFRCSRGKVGFFSRCHSGKGPHLALRGESPGFSRDVAANVGLLSCLDGDFRDLLMGPQENQVSKHVARGLSGFLCSHGWGGGTHWSWGQKLRVSLQCQYGSPGSSGVSTGESGLISCGVMQVHSPLELEKQCQASCLVDTVIGCFLLTFHRAVTPANVF